MNFLTMTYFLAVEKERSFSRAAEGLHITQQTLSAHIANLEKELGNQLFVRHVPLELTYAGEVFTGYAKLFSQRYDSMMKEFQDISNQKKGILRVGIGHTRGRIIMPTLVEAFQKEYPGYTVYLDEGPNEALAKKLMDGQIDLAIGAFHMQPFGIEILPFYEEEMLMLISEELMHRLYGDAFGHVAESVEKGDLSSLRKCPFVIGMPDDISGMTGRHMLERFHLISNIKAYSDNVETLLDMCLRGVGACFCPRNLMETTLTEEKQKELHAFLVPTEAKYEISFGIRSQSYQWSAISEFVRIARLCYNAPRYREE